MFHVYLLPNTNTEFCGEYLLRVNASSIILHEPFDLMKPLVTWKLNTLRSYGRDESKFTFEAGRLVMTKNCNILTILLLATIFLLLIS